MAVSKNVDAWKDKITTMSFVELADVEYQPVGIGTKWKYMFEIITGDNKDTLRCVLCETNKIGHWTSIKQHIEGKRHLGKFRVAVRDVRHRTIRLNSGGAQAQKPKTPAPVQAKTGNNQAKTGNTPTKPPIAAKTAQPGKPAAAGNAQLAAKSVANTSQQPSKVIPQNSPKRQETPAPQKQSTLPKETAGQNTKDVTDSPKGSETGAGASQGGKKVINPCSLLAKSNEVTKPAFASLQEFRNNLAKMDLSDLLLIEYRYVNTDFVHLFEQSNNTYTCKMCRSTGISGVQAIRSHMSNKQHQTNISLVKTLHHPLLYPTKENAKTAEPARMPPPSTPAPQRVPPSSTPAPQRVPPSSTPAPQRVAPSSTPLPQRVPPSSTPLPQRVPPSSTPQPQRVPPSSTPQPQRVPPSSTPQPQRVPPSSTPAPQAAKPSIPVQSKPIPAKPSPSTTSVQKQTPPAPAKVDASKQNAPDPNLKMETDDLYDGKNLIPLMKTLDVPELLKIEYRFSAQTAEWKHMFRQVHENAFKCLLCATFLIKNVHDLRQHIGSIRHQSAIKSCKQLHHPDLAPVKPSSKTTTTTEQRKIMNDKQFREHVLKLTVSELCEIEYLMKSSWYKLASCTPSQNHYSCYLCDLINATGTINNMRVHLQSKRHMERMESVQMLFHPFYTASKQELLEQVKEKGKETEIIVEIPQKVVCTIELDDSPEREIPRFNEKSKTVLNPAALAISNEMEQGKQGTAIKTIMNVGRNTSFVEHNQQKQNTSFGSQNNQLNSTMVPGGNPFYQMRDNQNQSWQSDPMRSQGNTFNKSMSMAGYPPQGNNFGQSQLHRNQFDQTLLMGSSQGNNFGQSQPMGLQNNQSISMGPPGNNLGQSRNLGSQHIHSVQTLPSLMESNNFQSMQQNNSVQRFQPANSNLRKQYGPNAQQGDRIIIPRVQQKDENPNNTAVSFASKDIINDTIQPIEGLIGVEYVIKILRNANDPAPRYECSLCEVEVDGTSMQWHLKGLHHRTKYLDRHFPTVMKQFQQYSNKPEMSYLMSQITDKLAVAIEEYHGRDLPFECLIDEFRLNHDGIKSKVFSFRHPSELTGPSFTNVVDKNELDEFIARKSFRMPEPDKKRKPTFDVHENMQPKRLRDLSPLKNSNLDNINRNQSQSMQDNADRNRRYERNPVGRRQSRSRSRERGRSPPGDSRRYQQYNNRDDWSSYVRMFDHSLVDLKKDYEEYKRDPECHPAYNSEWKKFWTRRTDELRKEGRNPSSYNFQPEWVKFFSRRVHELYEEAVEDLRLSLRKRLNLPMRTNNQSLDEIYHVGIDRIASLPYDVDIDMERQQSQLNQVQQQRPQQYIQSQQQQQQHDKGRFDDIQQQQQQQRQGQFNSAQQQTNQRRTIDEYNTEDQYRRQVGDSQISSSNIENKIIGNVADEDEEGPDEEESDRDEDDDIIEIVDIKTEVIDSEYDDGKNMTVSVLRLLTALEDHLGILGPRVIDLLSKALTLEKIKPNGVDEALLNQENYVFLETVREKLKGQLLAGVIEGPKERAVKKVITDMNKMFEKYKHSIPNAMPVSTTTTTATKDPPIPPKMTPAKKPPAPVVLNKEELATKLASALAAQGKTDVTAEQLEQLVAVYALIERKQHENALAGKPNQSNQKKSLSDTLIDFLKPNSNANSTPPLSVQKQPERNNNYGRTNQSSYATSAPYANQSFRNRTPPRLMEMDSYQQPRMNQSQQHNMGPTQRMDQGSYSNMGGGNYSNMGGSSYTPSNPQRPTSNFSFINTPFSSLSQFDTSLKLNTQVNDKWASFTSNRTTNVPNMISYPDLRRNNPNNNNSGVGSANRASSVWDNQGPQQSRTDNFGIWQQFGNNATRRF